MTECVMCERHCSGIALDRASGVVPRGFSFGDSGEKALAVIFGEPGGISGRTEGTGLRELRLYLEQRTPAALFQAVDDFTFRCFHSGNWDGQANPFHRRVAELLTDVFGSIQNVMRSCYFTNLTKCEKVAGAIPSTTRSTCYTAFLKEEMRIVRPRAALLFGRNAGAFTSQIAALGAVVIVTDHPSARPPVWLGGSARINLVTSIRSAIGEKTARPIASRPSVAKTPRRTPEASNLGAMSSRRPWIDQYLSHLLSDPPAQTRTTPARNGIYPGVRINGGAVRLELYAHDEYIRVGILSTDRRVYDSVRGIPGFEVIKPAKSWFTGYIREERGTAAIDRLISGTT